MGICTGAKVTKKQRETFIKALTISPNVTRAAKAANMGRVTAYALRNNDAEFAALWDDALEQGVDSLEAEAQRRALEGSDVLLIFLLKTRGKARGYVERKEVSAEIGGPQRWLEDDITPALPDDAGAD